MSDKTKPTVADDASESQETRQSIQKVTTVSQQQIELDALAEIVAVQAQALNDVILSANNLQQRVAHLEEQALHDQNGSKKRLISLS